MELHAQEINRLLRKVNGVDSAVDTVLVYCKKHGLSPRSFDVGARFFCTPRGQSMRLEAEVVTGTKDGVGFE